MAWLTTNFCPLRPQARAELGTKPHNAATTSSAATMLTSCLQNLRGIPQFLLRSICCPQRALPAAIQIVKHQSYDHPNKETNPIHDGQAGHQQQAGEDGDDRGDGTAGGAEGAMAVRFTVAQNQNSSGHQRKSEQRADIGKVCERADIQDSRGYTHYKSRRPGGKRWSLITRMHARKNF